MSTATAAASGDVLTLSLAVAGTIIVFLAGLVWYFIRLRVRESEKDKTRFEEKLVSSIVKIDNLEKELHKLGAEVQNEFYDRFVTKSVYERNQLDQKEKFAALDKKIEDLKQGQTDTMLALGQIKSRMEAGFQHVTSLLSKRIEIKNQGD